MARIRPFAGWRYTRQDLDLTPVVAPPYDVISAEQRESLLSRDEHNVVALELPDGPLDPSAAGNRYETGRATWDAWREEGVLGQDPEPAVYVLEQSYDSGGKAVRRRAFIVELELEPFDAGVVLPHERTLPKALGDRFELIKATAANFSQVFGLFEDAEQRTEEIFSAVMSTDPIELATDDDGVVSTLWATTDPSLVGSLQAMLADRQVFIADGHHRYTTALANRDLRRRIAEEAGESQPDAPWDFVMMALVNMEDPDLVVLPTHRVADAPKTFDAGAFKAALAEHFVLEDLPAGHPSGVLDSIDEPAFLMKTREDERALLVWLRPDVDLDAAIPVEHSSAWKSLDVAVLQELVLAPLLQIHPDRPETLDRLSFHKEAHAALRAAGDHDVAFVLRPTRMNQLRSVALSGETMPQKSTYFYPKLLSGLVFRSAE